MAEITVPVKRLTDAAVLPENAYVGDAGVDLRSTEALVLQPFERAAVSTGIAVAIPDGYAGYVIPRSGLAIKHGISIVNAPGLIDSGYRGELKVILVNLDPHTPFTIEVGDRIAQLVIAEVGQVHWAVTDCLDETQRGKGGLGSSGVE